MTERRVLVITGGSSGIGKATAEYFSAGNYVVYDLSRHGADNGDIRHVDCDVTDIAACSAAVNGVISQSGRIDVLICNAGMGVAGAVEFTGAEQARSQMNVNFHGTLNIVNAVLPFMRATHGGHILFVSSLAAVFPLPFQGCYSASKAAVNAVALALRNEVRPFGIKVSCLLPGDVRTGFADARRKNMAGADVYKNMSGAFRTMEQDEHNGLSPVLMARKLYKMAATSCPAAYYTVGFKYRLFLFLNRMLSTSFANKVVGMLY